MRTRSLLTKSMMTAALLSVSFAATAQDEYSVGQPADLDYGKLVYEAMVEQNLAGENQIKVIPFEGNRPHSSIQEILKTEATIDGHTGELIVKRNHSGEDLTPKDVYSDDTNQYFDVYAVMFQREEGYFPDGGDYYWAEFNADGSVFEYQGQLLAGQLKDGCVACHQAIGGDDLQVMTSQ